MRNPNLSPKLKFRRADIFPLHSYTPPFPCFRPVLISTPISQISFPFLITVTSRFLVLIPSIPPLCDQPRIQYSQRPSPVEEKRCKESSIWNERGRRMTLDSSRSQKKKKRYLLRLGSVRGCATTFGIHRSSPAFLLMRVWVSPPRSRVACSTTPVIEQCHILSIVLSSTRQSPDRAACFNVILTGRAPSQPHVERRTAESSTMVSNCYHLQAGCHSAMEPASISNLIPHPHLRVMGSTGPNIPPEPTAFSPRWQM